MHHSQYSNISDEELLKHFRADGNNKWLEELLPRYSLLLFGVCMKYLKNEEDAKDCVQQIFLKVINEVNKYEVTYFKSWLYMVAKNHCLMWIRSRRNNRAEWTDNLQIAADTQENETHIEKEKLISNLHENLARLKPQQRQCLDYFYLQKKSYAEISELTGFSLSQVKSYLQNGKRNLEIMLNGNNK